MEQINPVLLIYKTLTPMGWGELMRPGTRNVEIFISKLLAHRHALVSCAFQGHRRNEFSASYSFLVESMHLHIISHHNSWQPEKGSSKEAHIFLRTMIHISIEDHNDNCRPLEKNNHGTSNTDVVADIQGAFTLHNASDSAF